jgi:hypothetical protein
VSHSLEFIWSCLVALEGSNWSVIPAGFRTFFSKEKAVPP